MIYKKIKIKLIFLLLLLVLACLTPSLNIKAESSDAIAVRIVENPFHYSSLRWYQSQNFEGSPQLLEVDGYEAVRNGRTVYINAANIIDKNDGSPRFLYTNIFIISYNQDVQGVTLDIFGQLLKNFKFNTNLTDPGFCSKTAATACLSDDKCPTGEYCNSKKAKVIRDVKRLADLEEIQSRLNSYKQKNQIYPTLGAGSYLTNLTLSTWPSWQQSLGQSFGFSLPIDPINQLGACSGLDPVTCWDYKNQKFATNLSQLLLPSGSHVYVYQGNSQGNIAKYCAQMESNYDNIKVFNCFDDKNINHQPVINGVNLTGRSKDEFSGYVSVSDPDGDPVKLSIDLVSPDAGAWLSKGWKWVAGLNKFSVESSPSAGQKKISALKTGNTAVAGYYKVKLTADDGQGAANSLYSRVYDLTVNPLPMTLEKAVNTIVIGNSDSLTISGTDSNKEALTNLFFESASFNTTSLDKTALENNGFVISGMSLRESFKSAQQTGVYVVNVYSPDPSVPTIKVSSSFSYIITNQPPVFQKLTATFSNNTSQVCNPGQQCSIAIDNSEAAKIEIKGSDPDGHQIKYSLVDNFSGNLSVDPNSGIISGFEKLNFQQLADKNFNVSVKIADQYCSNSAEEECSSIYSFNILVEKYCSLSMPESTIPVNSPKTITINKTGELLDTEIVLNDCSVVGLASADVKFVGEPNNKAIVLISDLSKSMDANIDFNGATGTAINRLKNALIDNNSGFLSRVYNIIDKWPDEHSIQIGLIGYNLEIRSYEPLRNLALAGSLSSLKTTIKNYSTDYQTHTLKALNKAEEALSSITDRSVERVIILMSDGVPGIDAYKIHDPHCDPITCRCGDKPGGTPGKDCNDCCTLRCNNLPASDPACVTASCTPLFEREFCGYCIKNTCNCDGTFDPTLENNGCNEPAQRTDCSVTGQLPGSCGTCYTPWPPNTSVFNNLFNWKGFIGRLFNIKPALAITNQSVCMGNKTCEDAFPGSSCSSSEELDCERDFITNCDLTPDVDAQATALKQSGVAIYTIYYDTSGSADTNYDISESEVTGARKTMCNWSSNNGKDCTKNINTFTGTDINTMINKVLGRIITKPKEVMVGSSKIIDPEPTSFINTVGGAPIDGLTCGAIKPIVTYQNDGYLEFSNLKLSYCEAKLHP